MTQERILLMTDEELSGNVKKHYQMGFDKLPKKTKQALT